MSFDPDEYDPPLTHFWEAETLPGEPPVAFAISARHFYLPGVDKDRRPVLTEVPLRSVRSVTYAERRPLPVLVLMGAVGAVILWFSLGLPPPGGSFDKLAPTSPLCLLGTALVFGWVGWRLPRSGRLTIVHGGKTFVWDLPVSNDDRYPGSRDIVTELIAALTRLRVLR